MLSCPFPVWILLEPWKQSVPLNHSGRLHDHVSRIKQKLVHWRIVPSIVLTQRPSMQVREIGKYAY